MQLIIHIPLDLLIVLLWTGIAIDGAIWMFVGAESRSADKTLFRWFVAVAAGLAVVIAVAATAAITILARGG